MLRCKHCTVPYEEVAFLFCYYRDNQPLDLGNTSYAFTHSHVHKVSFSHSVYGLLTVSPQADGVSAAFTTAMEPVLAQLTKAMKQRVVPPQPQLLQPNGQIRPQQQQQRHTPLAASATPLDPEGGTAPAQFTSASGLPPWDNIRYVWRGAMKVSA